MFVLVYETIDNVYHRLYCDNNEVGYKTAKEYIKNMFGNDFEYDSFDRMISSDGIARLSIEYLTFKELFNEPVMVPLYQHDDDLSPVQYADIKDCELVVVDCECYETGERYSYGYFLKIYGPFLPLPNDDMPF